MVDTDGARNAPGPTTWPGQGGGGSRCPSTGGFNFRGSLGYATDGAQETIAGGDAYPHTYTIGGDSPVGGWQTGGGGIGGTRDRDNSLDRRLAGIAFDNTVGHYFQIDLPSTGSYDIHLAMGDGTSGNDAYWDLLDNATVFASFTQSPASAHFVDAAGTDYAAASWPGGETKITRTFTSTTFKLQVKTGGTTNSVIAHIRIVTASSFPGDEDEGIRYLPRYYW